MTAIRTYLTTIAFTIALQSFAGHAAASEQIGMLECKVASSVGYLVTSTKALECAFWPERAGRPEYYLGTLRRIGLDIGITGQGILQWAVFAEGPEVVAPRFPLAGAYAGVVSEVVIATGLGANVLIGGNEHAISLQPFAFNAAFGVSLAAGSGELVLEPAPPSAMH